jgi:hypothetical protein
MLEEKSDVYPDLERFMLTALVHRTGLIIRKPIILARGMSKSIRLVLNRYKGYLYRFLTAGTEYDLEGHYSEMPLTHEKEAEAWKSPARSD